ncbi:MAG: glycosyltransferase family 2 protein [Chlorobi bacterium]|nr:glycosyltransferase family 2 protein [Chlorobiota bacterium]
MSLVSIITATYNSEKFIEQTINSVINQTYQNWELLITDDCSKDNTLKLLDKYSKSDSRIKVFQLSKNSGAAVARNNSIKHSNGSYIAFLDSDDLWIPDKLEKQIKFMTKEDLAFSYSYYQLINENGESLKKIIKAPDSVNYTTLLRTNYIGCLTAVYNCRKMGKMYMPNIRKRQDYALWLGILKSTPHAKCLKEPLAFYRIRKHSISSNKLELLKFNWKIYREVEGFGPIRSFMRLVIFLFYFAHKKMVYGMEGSAHDENIDV